jgi:hypothetical protein
VHSTARCQCSKGAKYENTTRLIDSALALKLLTHTHLSSHLARSLAFFLLGSYLHGTGGCGCGGVGHLADVDWAEEGEEAPQDSGWVYAYVFGILGEFVSVLELVSIYILKDSKKIKWLETFDSSCRALAVGSRGAIFEDGVSIDVH